MTTDGPPWRVGDLARATGVTVRALHHYEQLDLVTASRRTAGGHRLYDERDLQRLYRVRALRALGLSLTEVRDVLRRDAPLAELLADHLARVDEQLRRLGELRARLEHTRQQVDGTPDADDLLAVLEAMTRVADHDAGRRGTPDPAASEARWRRAGERLRALMDAGLDPADPAVVEVAAAIAADIRGFADDDPAVLDALARLRRSTAPVGLAGWDRPLLQYLDRALGRSTDERPTDPGTPGARRRP